MCPVLGRSLCTCFLQALRHVAIRSERTKFLQESANDEHISRVEGLSADGHRRWLATDGAECLRRRVATGDAGRTEDDQSARSPGSARGVFVPAGGPE